MEKVAGRLYSKRFEPICPSDDLAQEEKKDTEENDATPQPTARTPSTKTKVAL